MLNYIKQSFIIVYLFFLLILPVCFLFLKSFATFSDNFLSIAFAPIAICSYRISFLLSFIACLINTLVGFLLAWVLVRYKFPGQKVLDVMIDLPFSIPTAVAGFSFSEIYGSKTWIGQIFLQNGIQIVFTNFGVLLGMVFVSFPFGIRNVQPILLDIDQQIEETAWCLGATSWQTFSKILWPILMPAFLTGAILSFSRCIGEYGAIVLLSSNYPFKNLITPVLIFQCLEQYDYLSATIFGSILLFFCLVFFFFLNFILHKFKI
uniref:Sulfate transport system permease protein CysT n=1 Tax=Boodleopsis sp. FL1161 TaxID=2364084 RepID=A0A386AZ68_9CHLO|nr:Sulfate ABC transporter permease subunit CysT [Boodleopsis sp. FL1161]